MIPNQIQTTPTSARAGVVFYLSSVCSSFHNLSIANEITAGRLTPFSAQSASSFSIVPGARETVILACSAIKSPPAIIIPSNRHHVNIKLMFHVKHDGGGVSIQFLRFPQHFNVKPPHLLTISGTNANKFPLFFLGTKHKAPMGGVVVPPMCHPRKSSYIHFIGWSRPYGQIQRPKKAALCILSRKDWNLWTKKRFSRE